MWIFFVYFVICLLGTIQTFSYEKVTWIFELKDGFKSCVNILFVVPVVQDQVQFVNISESFLL